MKMRKVFYSWQSDSPSALNRNLIENALKDAIKLHNRNQDNESNKFEFDKDTRGESGSIDIVEAILKKVKHSSIVVADVTPVTTSKSGKAMPNSNVLFEAGYAVGKLGWERTILVANTAHHEVEDLPFDFRTKRILSYKLSEKDEDLSKSKSFIRNSLTKAFQTNMKLIAATPESIPQEVENSSESIKFQRDSAKLIRFLKVTPTSAIQRHITLGHDGLMDIDALTALYNMQSVQRFHGFRLYDKKLNQLLNDLIDSFEASLSFGYNFHYKQDIIYSFQKTSGVSFSDYLSILTVLEEALEAFLAYVHENFLDIDLEALSKEAWGDYVKEVSISNDDT